MGILGFIALIVVCIIAYNIWFNTKYSEGEQIVMRHRTEQKRQQRQASKHKTEWKNRINDNFTKDEKLAMLYTLQLISVSGANNKNTPKRIEQITMIVKKQLSFGISNEERETYEIQLTPESLKNTMSSLDGLAKELFLSDVFNLLSCGGEATEREFLVAANACEKIVGITASDFEKSIEKIANMKSFFNG